MAGLTRFKGQLLHLVGMPKINQQFGALKKKGSSEVDRIFQKEMWSIIRDAKKHVGVDTGRLRASGRVGKKNRTATGFNYNLTFGGVSRSGSGPGRKTKTGGVKRFIDYAEAQEFGWKHWRSKEPIASGHPFYLRNAINKSKPGLAKRIGQKVRVQWISKAGPK